MTAHCAIPDCTRPGVVTVSASAVRISFRTDHAQMPAWSQWLRCWTCATAELDRHITAATSATANQKGTDMAKVTITVETGDRQTRATYEHDDEAQALAKCIYQIAETSPSDRVAWIADAVYRLMRGEPEPTR